MSMQESITKREEDWKNKMNKLSGARCYIGGGMDRVADGGVEWREKITPKLHDLNIVVLNPCDKPIKLGYESIENRDYRQKLIDDKNYAELSKQMKEVRVTDLRMIDISDFLIINFDTDQHLMGTIEEAVLANRQKKAILLYCHRGISEMYHWVFGMIPYQMMFEHWDDLFDYLKRIDDGTNTEYLNRWMLFDYDRLTPPKQQDEYGWYHENRLND